MLGYFKNVIFRLANIIISTLMLQGALAKWKSIGMSIKLSNIHFLLIYLINLFIVFGFLFQFAVYSPCTMCEKKLHSDFQVSGMVQNINLIPICLSSPLLTS